MFRHHLGALALLAAMALPLSASAQTMPVPGAAAPAPTAPVARHHHRHHDRFVGALRKLQLSDAQKQQIAGILKASRAADKDQKSIDPQTRRAHAQALHAQIESVLTADQRTQLQTQLAREPRHAMKPNPNAPAAPPAPR